MGNYFAELCDDLDDAVFDDYLCEKENLGLFKEYLQRWEKELNERIKNYGND